VPLRSPAGLGGLPAWMPQYPTYGPRETELLERMDTQRQ